MESTLISFKEALKKQPIKALLFDLDDTLYDTKPIYARGLENAWLAFQQSSFYKPCTQNEFCRLYDQARLKTKTTLEFSPSKNSRLIYFHYLVCALYGYPVAKLVFELDQAYEAVYDLIDFSTATTVLQALKGKYKIGIVTNQTMQAQFAKLEKLDPAGGLIDLIVTSEAAGVEKPDRRIFEMALTELNCRPIEAMMIGDHEEHDIRGASTLGMHSLQILNTDTDSLKLRNLNPITCEVGRLDNLIALLT